MKQSYNLKPNELFTTDFTRPITETEKLSLSLLYRPFITSDAYSLIDFLWSNRLNELDSIAHPHTLLLNALVIDIKTIEVARQRLEAIGLLKTYIDQHGLQNVYFYKLLSPVDPIRFFKDDLLSTLLLKSVGVERFTELRQQLIHTVHVSKDFKEISSDFSEIFQLSDDIVKPNEIILKAQDELKNFDDDAVSKLKEDDFDFSLLKSILSHGYVDDKSVETNRRLILVQHTLYGLDEIQMAKFINDATNFETNQLDGELLKQLIANTNFNGRSNSLQKTAVEPKQESETTSQKSNRQLTSDERELISLTKELSPITFIESLKSEIGGYVANSEKRLLDELISRDVLSTSVINILIYYVLVDQEAATLTKNFVDAIANDWIKHKIGTPEQALAQIKNRVSNIQARQTKKRQPVQKEQLPSWAIENNSKNPQATNPSSRKKEIQAQLEKLKKQTKH